MAIKSKTKWNDKAFKKQFVKASKKGMSAALHDAAEEAKAHVPIATGNLQRNIGYTEPVKNGTVIEGELYANTFYAAAIETGNMDLMGEGESTPAPSVANTGNRNWLRNAGDNHFPEIGKNIKKAK